MYIPLSQRADRIKPSATLSVSNRAAELKAAGIDIVDLSAGEPDFDTPDFIKQAAIDAINAGFTKYTAVDGTPSLKQAIIEKFSRENQLHYLPEQILVSTGAKQSLANVFLALLNAGDEVIIPAPFWVSYPDMVLLADGLPVIIPTDMQQQFKITPTQLAAAITEKTRILVINSPSNPSGMAYTRQELAALGEVLREHPRLLVITDDIYEHILWTQAGFSNIVNACPELYERTIVVNGVSKAYAMTGWRIGYAAGPVSVISAMKKIQSQVTSNPNSIAQKAAETALQARSATNIQAMTAEFKRRHDYLYAALNQIPGFTVLPSDGTFYALVHVKSFLSSNTLKNDVEFSEFLLKEARVAVVPGSAFGASGYIRLSYATSMALLEEAVNRIESVVKKL